MKTNKIEAKELYRRILVALFSIDNFSQNYYSINSNIKKIAFMFVQDADLAFEATRKTWLMAITEKDLSHTCNAEVLENANYANTDIIDFAFSKHDTSRFLEFSDEEVLVLMLLDICYNSVLQGIFYSKKIKFAKEDFIRVLKAVLGLSEKKFLQIIKKTSDAGFVCVSQDKQEIIITKKFTLELIRLSEIPECDRVDLEDFDVDSTNSGVVYDENAPLSSYPLMAFTGDQYFLYINEKFCQENARFWYLSDETEIQALLDCFEEEKLTNQVIWVGDYGNNSPVEELEIMEKAMKIDAKLIVSGIALEHAFGMGCIKIFPNDSYFSKQIFNMFSPGLSGAICVYLKKLDSVQKKFDFLYKVRKLVDENSDEETVLKKLSEFQYDEPEKTAEDKTERLCAIDEKEYQKRYGDYDPLSALNPNQAAEYEKIKRIHEKLIAPSDYLRADKEMLVNLDTLLDQHPNIIDKELIYSFLKSALLFSSENIIRLTPMILVGPPASGKSLLCRQLRELLKQDNDIWIQMATGGGVSSLVGCTPEYKSAYVGKILSSIWSANNKTNILNSLIVLDEIEKAGLSLQNHDPNQNVYGTLLELFSDECMKHFRDNFFDLKLHHFYPNFICTANSLEPIPEALLDRVVVINFKDYTEKEVKEILIPRQFELFRKQSNLLVSETLSDEDIEIIFKLCKGKPRQIVPCIKLYLTAKFDIDGQKHQLSSSEIEHLLKMTNTVQEERQMGFFC